MYIEHTDIMLNKKKKKKENNKTTKQSSFKLLQRQRRQNPSGYALARGSSFWLGWEQGASLALGPISWFSAFSSFVFIASLALADGFFPLSLSFSPSAPWPWSPVWLNSIGILGRERASGTTKGCPEGSGTGAGGEEAEGISRIWGW